MCFRAETHNKHPTPLFVVRDYRLCVCLCVCPLNRHTDTDTHHRGTASRLSDAAAPFSRSSSNMATVASKALHEQLSLIMAALTKAAVAEICEVVDEGYALLQLEISRRNQENEALRKKLHLIESIVIRGAGTSGGTGGGGARGKVAEPEVVTVAVAEIPPRRSGDGGGGAVLKEEVVHHHTAGGYDRFID